MKKEITLQVSEILAGSISMDFVAKMPMAPSWTEKKKKDLAGKECTAKPDLDNLLKFYMDVMNEIAYLDDRLISEIHAKKIYSDNSGIEITLREKND